MTKFYAIPGLRLGFGIAAPSVCKRLSDGKDVWNVNLLAQRAGAAALSDRTYEEKTRAFLQEEYAYFFPRLNAVKGIRAYPSCANFILLSIQEAGQTSDVLSAKLRARGILVRDCANYPGLDDSFLRIAVRRREENDRFLHAMEAVIE